MRRATRIWRCWECAARGIGRSRRGGILTNSLRSAPWKPPPICRIAFGPFRSEEHTSELQSLMRISYAVFCLKKKTKDHVLKRLHRHTTVSELHSTLHTIALRSQRHNYAHIQPVAH